MTTLDVGLPTVDYENERDPEDAHRILAAARERGPVALGAHGPEILTYDLARTVLRDDRFAIPKGLALASQGITSGPVWDRAVDSLLSRDGEDHHRLRRLVCKAFTPKASARLRDTCVEVINDLVDPHAATGAVDVVADIARPYPIPVICALLGAPAEDWSRFSAWADDIFKVFAWNVAEDADDIERAWTELDGYNDALVRARRDALTDDLFSDLIRAEVDGDRLAHDELLMLAGGLLMAGTDTTRNQLAAAVGVLCDRPDQWELLAANPELIPRAVDELMRFCPVIFTTIRTARDDVELPGLRVAAGEMVIVNIAAANRDPAAFDRPDRLDVTREGAAAMLTFGGGMHYCLGSHLARTELVEALTVITQRMPHPRRTAPERWKPLTGISGPATLPLAFDAGN
ncbi:cytochrome P450 [Mycolicibacterium litorale]|uniref:Steroid C26-monooxygenase n=1 Tax=Mycolicibacterium litorale TaxID=758802 RepID=A0AAD1IGW7_9MYCO|nr:cytochrome P450 [Mycolicibacterium litorale]MCV7414373.1 cytochrome P450 [Mycolicibacterium litorale]TDY01357.1 cytochrome P450 [Mycolicibacterium litorale]BBY15430.1 cytochrome P450 hydroxylase [Mycolicibacterium litorale]